MRKKRPVNEKRGIREKVCDSLALPEDMLLDLPRISLSGNRELEIENYKNVLEYLDTSIQLNCKDYVIKICGCKLSILSITDEAISIRGNITQIIFQK